MEKFKGGGRETKKWGLEERVRENKKEKVNFGGSPK